MLEEAGFQVNLTTEHSEKAEGIVIGQEPAAGEMAAASAFVTIKVSLGPEMVQVPDLRFMELEKARETLDELGLVLAEPQTKNSDVVAEGLVISQNMEPGEEVSKGRSIVVEVSLGPESKEDDGDGQDDKKSSGGTRQTTAAPQTRPSPTQAPTPAPTPAPTQPPSTPAPTQPPSTPAPTEPPTTQTPIQEATIETPTTSAQTKESTTPTPTTEEPTTKATIIQTPTTKASETVEPIPETTPSADTSGKNNVTSPMPMPF